MSTQKILCFVYSWPYIFHDYIHVDKICKSCQIFAPKTQAPSPPVQPIVIVIIFFKWGINFIECHVASSDGHKYIIVVIDYFTKCTEVMMTIDNISTTTTCFFFNHIITHIFIPNKLVFDHSKSLENELFQSMASMFMFTHVFSTLYYPQGND